MATKTHTNSLPSMAISQEALFDELVKIGEAADKDKKGLKNALKHIAAGTAGVGTGYLAAEGLSRGVDHIRPGTFKPKKPIPGRGSFKHRALTIGLPIGAGAGATLWSRYRQKMQDKIQGKSSDGGR